MDKIGRPETAPSPERRVFSINEAIWIYHLSRNRLYSAIADGSLPTIVLNRRANGMAGRRLIADEDLRAWLATFRTPAVA